MLKLVNVGKIYNDSNVSVGLRKIDLELNINEFVVITGSSGSGKTTLLNILSGMDTYEEGNMYLNGEDIGYYGAKEYEEYRRKYISFIFQNFNLNLALTVYENIELPLLMENIDKKTRKERVIDLAKKVGLEEKLKNRITELSGGECQRVAIARALASDKSIIVCDEITGNLDSKNTKEIIALLKEVCKDKLIIYVTHDESEIINYATRIIRLSDGSIVSDTRLKETNNAQSNKKEYSTKFSSLLKITSTGLIKTPKKTSFMFLVFLATIICVLFSIYLYKITYTKFMPSNTKTIFYNNCDNRVLMKKDDQTAFSNTDIDYINGLKWVESYVEKDIVMDVKNTYVKFDSNKKNKALSYIESSKTITKSDLSYGKMPSNNNEIVINMSLSNLKLYSLENTANSVLGKKIIIDYPIYESREYTISGIIISSKTSAYLTNDEFNSLYPNILIYSSNMNFHFDIDVYNNYESINSLSKNYVPVIDNTLEDDEVTIIAMVDNEDYALVDTTTTGSLNLSNTYTSTTLNNLAINFNLIYDEEIIDDSNFYPQKILLNENTYNEIRTEDSYQVSLFLDDKYSDYDELFNDLSNNGYIYYYSNYVEYNYSYIFLVLIRAFVIIMAIVFFSFVYFIAFLVLRNISFSKIADYQIYKALGANKKDLKVIIYSEYFITSFIVSVLVLLVVKIGSRFTSFGIFGIAFYFSFFEYLLIILAILLLAYLLSRKFYKLLSKKISVINEY